MEELIEWAGGCFCEFTDTKTYYEACKYQKCLKCGVNQRPIDHAHIDLTTWAGYGWLSERMTEMGVWESFCSWLTSWHYPGGSSTAFICFNQLPTSDRVALIDEWRQTL